MRALRWTGGLIMVFGLSLFCSGARADDSQLKGKEQIWEGVLKPAPGVELRLVIHATLNDGAETVATLDSPDEDLRGLKLSSVVINESKMSFDLKVTNASYEGKLNTARSEATGTWSQRGASTPLTFVKKDKVTPEPKLVGKEEIWEGKIGTGPAQGLRLVLRVQKREDGGLVGRFQSPDQTPLKMKVDSVTLDKTKLAFAMRAIDVTYEGKLSAEGNEAVGTFVQSGMKLPLTLKKTDRVAALNRPQTPKPPFPYKTVELKYQNEHAGIMLAGTLTLPERRGPFPAVILISGSGAQDRDETLFGHKPFMVLADMLTRRGLAVLRVDDRGVGGSSGNTAKATSEEFAGDVEAGIALLKSRPDIDGGKIGLIGHSEGGLIAPIVAARSRDVAFIVLLAGTGLPGDEIMMMQARLIGKVMGGNDKDLDRHNDMRKRLFEIIKTEKDAKKASASAREQLEKLLGDLSPVQKKAVGEMGSFADSQMKMLESPWFRFFLSFDPRPTLEKVRCPVLALNGERDLQVPPKENLEEIAKAIKKGGNTQVTTQQLPGLNHLFQTCKTGSITEYNQIEETIAAAALNVIGDWVVKQTSAAK